MLRILTPLLFLSISAVSTTADEKAISPESVIDLIHGLDPEEFHVHLNEKASLTKDPAEIWRKNDDGTLTVTGKGMGYVRTKQSFRNYHLVAEYKWGERTLANRVDRSRDCGILLHSFGPDGAFGNTWMSCIEAQMIEGGTGDLVALAARDEDGKPARTKFTGRATEDRDGDWRWTSGAPLRTFPAKGKSMEKLHWEKRDPNWTDVRGFSGAKDIEKPIGNWNRLEVVCRDDTIHVYVNGELVNVAKQCVPSSGFIGLQSEHAECHFRRLELHPLGSYSAAWSEASVSRDMGYSITGESILPREKPLSPEESLAKWEIDPDYEIQLVAAEPLTCDPVDVVWDTGGRMFVAEMGDYPLPAGDGAMLSRIRLLTDTDSDGVMDKATTWAAELDHVQGLMPLNGGLLATTRTAILFLKDTDGDDFADVRKVLFTSNEPRHNQLQVSSPRYGLNNEVFLSNGLDGKQIYPANEPDKVVEFTKLNLRYNPRTGELRPSTGVGQYGGTLDAFNRHFFCSNRNPAMFAVMPLEAVKRNPLAGIIAGHEDIQPPGAPVHPISLSHTTSSAHAGTHTAACGLAVYTGAANPELNGDLFVCDPTAQLVTRNKLIPNGASFTAERIGDGKEFLASGDEWARPVQIRNGPDGALYVVDMYRRFIDHSRFFPEEFAKSHYMRAGLDHGRIWRIVPKGTKTEIFKGLPDSTTELVKNLESDHGWIRMESQRLLVEQSSFHEEALPTLEELLHGETSPVTAAHILGTLSGIGQLTADHLRAAFDAPSQSLREFALTLAHEGKFADDLKEELLIAMEGQSPRVRFLAISLFPEISGEADNQAALVAEFPDDAWFRKAILSSTPLSAPDILAELLTNQQFLAISPAEATPALSDFSRMTAANGDLAKLAEVVSRLTGEREWWHFAVVSGISEGLKRSPLKQKSLAALIQSPPDGFAPSATILTAILDAATDIALDRNKPEGDRLAALSLVGQRPLAEKLEIAESLIALAESPAIQAAACQMLSRDNREQVAEFFFARWRNLAPTPRREALALITGNSRTGLALMKKMKAGEISPSIMPAMTRWSYGRSSNEEIKNLALELFGSAASDRAALVAEYEAELANHTGDPENGELVFQKAACITCHKVGDTGVDVGPSLNDVKIKQDVALMTDILDPNRAVEERWVMQTIETTDGRALSGLVHAEDAAAITLRVPGGLTMTIPRSEVKSLSTTGNSLMPIGLEAAISKTEMIDLIAFLKQR